MASRTANRLVSGTFPPGEPARGLRDTAIGSLKVVGFVVALGVVLAIPRNARAQGLYAGGAVGTTDIVVPVMGGNWDSTATYKLFLGYELPEIVGFEAAWVDLGGHDGEWVGNAAGTLHTSGWTAGVTGRIPVSKVFGFYGKVGYFFWNTRFDVDYSWGDPTTAGNSSGGELFWGAGMRFNVGTVSILGEVERYKTGDLGDHKAFALAVRYTF